MGKLFAFLLSIGSLSTVLGQCTVEQAIVYFKRPLHEFGNELLARISEATNNHFVASSLSLWTLLVSIAFGAEYLTREQLHNVLRLHPHPCLTKQIFGFMYDVSADNKDLIFKRHTALYGESNLFFKHSFRNRVEATDVIKLEEISFNNPDDVAANINEDIKSATGGIVDKIVMPCDLNRAEVLLIDVLCFKGTWKFKFMTQYTQPSAFYGPRGNRVGDVYLMYAKLRTKIANVPEIEARVLELPYENNRFSMLFFLPNKDATIQNVFESLQNFNLHSIFAQFAHRIVTIRIPRLQEISDNGLKNILADMGLTSMFGDNATFSQMAEVDFHVSNVIQKVVIEVTEDGAEPIEARKRQNVENEETFIANRPFLYMIVEKQAEIVIFTGAYSKPTVY